MPDGTVEVARSGWSGAPVRLRVALPLAAAGAALTVLGAALGVVGDQPPAGYAAIPLLTILALLAPLLAAGAVWAGHPVVAAGVLIGSALLVPGRVLLDLQFADDALLASRPELMVPASLAPLSASTGLWVLVLGHLAAGAAGVLAAGRAGAAPGSDYAAELDDGPPPRRYLIGWAFAGVTITSVALLRPTFRSHDAFLLAREVIEGPALGRAGGLLVAGAVVLGVLLAVSAARLSMAKGMVLGLLAATAGVTVPGIVAGLAVPRLSPELGPYLALATLGVLVLVVFLAPRSVQPEAVAEPAEQATGSRWESRGLHRVAGALGVLAGLAALGGALGTQLVVAGGIEQPDSFANRQLLPVGVLVGLLGAVLLTARFAAVRPAFTVTLASVFLVGASTLDAALTGTAISPAVRVGAGVWFTALAMVLAAVAAVVAGLAGAEEREDVDLTERGANLAVVAPAGAAVLLAIGGFGLPAVRAADFIAPGIWSDFRLASWGLVLGLVVVVTVAALAPVSRPARASSLLLGAAAVVGVHLLELPLTGGRAQEAAAGQGTWLSLACVVALVVAAVVALVTRPSRR